jgi:hypothetical protein
MQTGLPSQTQTKQQKPIIVVPETPRVILLPESETASYSFWVSLLAIAVSLWTFRLTLRRQLNEHRAAFFHNVVVDHCLNDIIGFHKEIYDLATKELPKLQASRDVGDVQQAMRKISSITRAISVQVGALVGPFDVALEPRSSQLFDDVRDKTTTWLEAEIDHETARGLPELSRILAASQTQLIRFLREAEFRQGWPAPSVRIKRIFSRN